MQLRLDAVTGQVQAIETQYTEVKSLLDQRNQQHEQLLLKVKDLQNKLAEQEATFETEMNTKTRLADLYKSASEDANRHLIDLEESKRALNDQLADLGGRLQLLQNEKEEAVKQAYDLVDKKETELESMQSQLNELASPRDTLHISPSASSVSRLQKSGKSFSDVYAEYVQTKAELLKFKQENERMKICLQEICADIEARVPQLQEERKENERLKREVMSISQQLIEVSRSHDRAMDEAMSLRKQLNDSERECNCLQVEVRDLSHQVQSLLQASDDTEKSLHVPENPNGYENAESIIDSRLVTFRSIQELQIRNQELLRVVRQLSKEKETDELERSRIVDAETQTKLDQAVVQLQELQEARQRQAVMVESVIRQRDMLKEMIQKNESRVEQPSTRNIAEPDTMLVERSERLQRDYELFRVEKEKSERSLDEQLQNARVEVSELRVSVAKANSELSFAKDRLTMIQQTSDMERKELAELRKRNTDYLDAILKQQNQIQATMNDVMQAREKEQKALLQMTTLNSELTAIKNAEKRLSTDNESLNEEKSRLGRLLANLQAMLSDRETTETEARQRLAQQLDVSERELQAARRRLAEIGDAHKVELFAGEREKRDLIQRLEGVNENNAKYREELASANARIREQSQRLSDLEAINFANQSRMDAFMSVPEGADTNRELAVTQIRIASLNDELEIARQSIKQYQTLAAQAESNLAELTQAFDNYKEHHSGELRDFRNELEDKKDQYAEVMEKYRKAESDAEDEKRSFEAREQALRANLARLESHVSELSQYEEQAKSQKNVFVEDLDRVKALLTEANERYQSEVVAHGQDLERLKMVKNETMSLQAAIADAQKASQLAHSKLEEQSIIWKREKEALNGVKVDLETKLTELAQQNNALITQLEQRFATEPNSPGKDDANEVVKYLRRQRDILQCELDSLQQDHRHLLAQHETMQKVLDETRALLEEERGQNNPRYVAMLSEYQNLLAKVERYNIVRESNQVLRQENARLTEKGDDANNELRQLQSTLQELNGRVRDLSAQMQTHGEEVRIIREDRDRWRARFNEIISKHDDRVDVVEVQRLREELETKDKDLATRPSTEEFSHLQLQNQQLENALRLRTEAYERNLAKVNSKLEATKALANELTNQQESSSSNVLQFILNFLGNAFRATQGTSHHFEGTTCSSSKY